MEDKIFVTKTSMPPYEEFIQAIKPLWESHWLTNMGIKHEQLQNGLELIWMIYQKKKLRSSA